MDLSQDLRYSIRSLAKSPLLTSAAVLTLGLGIGANTAMFEVVDRLFFKPPSHVVEPSHLMRIRLRPTVTPAVVGSGRVPASHPIGTYVRYNWLRACKAFSGIAAYGSTSRVSLGLGANAEQINAALVTASFFPTLGVQPTLGRFFTEDEDRLGAGAHVVVLSAEFWTHRFGKEPSALGKTLDVGKGVYTIVGVAPEGFSGIDLQIPDVWLPITTAAPELIGEQSLGPNWFWLSESVARLRPGVAPGSAAAEATAIYSAHAKNVDEPASVVLASIHDIPGTQTGVKLTLWLTGVCVIVLLIACANVANLLLARGVQRRREFAVRLALGASRGRLAQQLLAECALITVVGGGVALLLTFVLGRVLLAALLPHATLGSPFDARTLLYTGAAVIVTVLLAGLAPSILSSAHNLSEALKTGVREGNASRSGARRVLLTSQVALTVILLSGAALFVVSLHNVRTIPVGFDPEHLIAVSEDLGPLGYSKLQVDAAYQRIAARVRGEPGVEGVAMAVGSPWGVGIVVSVSVPGLDSLPRFPGGGPFISAVTPNYFDLMGTRIVRGREFTAEDDLGSPLVTVVSQNMADSYWPHQDPIGKCLMLMREKQCTEVVGVAQDTHHGRLVERSGAALYIPLAQSDSSVNTPVTALLVKTRGVAANLSSTIRLVIQDSFAELPYPRVDAYPTLFAAELRPWKVGSTLLSLFGILGLVLAAVGLYGAISYSVSQRTQEMGIRIALGANRLDVLGIAIGEGFRVTLAGICAGILASLLAGKAVASQLYGVSPSDPVILALVGVMLVVIALLASYFPGARATRTDPMVALRYE